MNKRVALGTTIYLVVAIIVALVAQAGLEHAVGAGRLASAAGTYLIAVPMGLWAGLRIGEITRGYLVLASMAMALLGFAGVVYILDAIARPAGGAVTWLGVVKHSGPGSLAVEFLLALVAPQIWLSAFRLAANNSSKPTPLRGAA
jgi:hypothetical protein